MHIIKVIMLFMSKVTLLWKLMIFLISTVYPQLSSFKNFIILIKNLWIEKLFMKFYENLVYQLYKKNSNK